jgi:hypothetical protein
MRVEIKRTFDNIVDTLACADGGVRFAKFRFFIEDMDKRAINGDKAAEDILLFMSNFEKLIDVAITHSPLTGG